MNILIVSSEDPIFLHIAKHLYSLLKKNNNTAVAKEIVCISPLNILKQRIRRAGLSYGLSQFLFKVFDLVCLRKKIKDKAVQSLQGFQCSSISSLNSQGAQTMLSSYNVVICIATSILTKETLQQPKEGCINVHPGVLPMYRGTGNFWAVVNNDWENIGCSCHWMTSRIDVGKVITITKSKADFASLWEMNSQAMMQGVTDLARIINTGQLMTHAVETDDSTMAYYSWYGFSDYFRFLRNLHKKCA